MRSLYAEGREIYEQIQAEVEETREVYDAALALYERGVLLHSLNAQALMNAASAEYEAVGNEYLVLLDENGTPLVFEPAETGVWLPTDAEKRLYTRLVSADGGAADSLAGFILHTRGGVKRHYNGSGLLVKVEERDGRAVSIIRKSDGSIDTIRNADTKRLRQRMEGTLQRRSYQ